MVNTGELLVEENLTRCYGVNCNQHWYPIEVGWGYQLQYSNLVAWYCGKQNKCHWCGSWTGPSTRNTLTYDRDNNNNLCCHICKHLPLNTSSQDLHASAVHVNHKQERQRPKVYLTNCPTMDILADSTLCTWPLRTLKSIKADFK